MIQRLDLVLVSCKQYWTHLVHIYSIADGKTPTLNSPCDCHYQGTLIDGTEFDSSYARGQPLSFAPNQVIRGWTEASECNTDTFVCFISNIFFALLTVYVTNLIILWYSATYEGGI